MSCFLFPQKANGDTVNVETEVHEQSGHKTVNKLSALNGDDLSSNRTIHLLATNGSRTSSSSPLVRV
jgi:hypothetical protein